MLKNSRCKRDFSCIPSLQLTQKLWTGLLSTKLLRLEVFHAQYIVNHRESVKKQQQLFFSSFKKNNLDIHQFLVVLWTCKVLCGSFYAPYIILYSFNKKCFHTVFCALFKPKSLWSQPIKHRLGFSAALCCVMALSLPQYQQVFCNSKNKTNKKEEDEEEEEEEGQQQQVWNTSRLTALYKARNYMPACLCGVMRLLQVQEQWLTVPDLVTAVRCLPKATADSSRLGDNK